jgi:chemotaxis protein MotB
MAGTVAFDRHRADLEPRGRDAVERLADFLVGGTTRLEIRGHNGDGALPASCAFCDGLDLSYARARAVADVLIGAGVARDRLLITARGDQDPLSTAAEPDAQGVNRRIEIIVHAAPAHARDQDIAVKESTDNG